MSTNEPKEPFSREVGSDFSFAASWPDDVTGQCRRLFEFDLQVVEGRDRLGALAFSQAPPAVESIKEAVRDLAKEPWDELPQVVTGGLMGELQTTNDVLDSMSELSSEQSDAHQQAETFRQGLEDRRRWFQEEARPHARRALVDRRIEERGAETPDESGLSDLRKQYARLRQDADAVNRELEARRDLVKQFREAGRVSAGEELASVFRQVARDRADSGRNWLIGVGISVVVAAGGAIVIFFAVKPPDNGSTNSHDYAALGLGVFLLGLLAFGVRICAQNYRVNRHQQAIANSKAAALSTFQRLAGSVEEEELRSAVTLTVAQAVFSSEETGLIDSSGDHVTLVERAVIPRLPGG